VVLMRSDPLDVPTALRIGRGTVHKMRQNLGWAIGYNTLALPHRGRRVRARGRARAPAPQIAALTMAAAMTGNRAASAGASLIPSPTMPPRRPGLQPLDFSRLVLGQHLGQTCPARK
jgi:hypothetical protein